jgi:uncharacterized protein
MIAAWRTWRWAMLASVAALLACSTSNPRLYSIAPVQGQERTGGPKIIELRQVGLARYLERSQIVRTSENYRLDVSGDDWWGEPLGAMLGRVLVQELGQRLPQSVVLNETGAVSSAADATVALDVERLDESTAGAVVLLAQTAISFKERQTPTLRSFRIEIATNAPGVQPEVAAISVAVGRLADDLASVLLAGPPAR